MQRTQHVDFSEVVADYFARTNKIHPDVSDLTPDRIKELIDAVPDNSELSEKLKDFLRKEGVCPVTH